MGCQASTESQQPREIAKRPTSKKPKTLYPSIEELIEKEKRKQFIEEMKLSVAPKKTHKKSPTAV